MTAVERAGRAGAAGPALRRPRGPGRRRRGRAMPCCRWAPCPTPRDSSAGPPTEAPDARGYWPCQAVATNALSGLPAIDTGVTASLGLLHTHKGWNTELLGVHGRRREADADGRPDGRGRRARCPDSDAVITGGTIDAFCDQIVSGAVHTGDVLVIFGATLICWVDLRRVADRRRADQLPQHDAGPVSRRWSEQRRRPLRRLGPPAAARTRRARARSASSSSPGSGRPAGCRSGCPTCAGSARRSRTTRCAPTSTGSTSARAPRRWSGPPTRRAGSWCGG